MRLFCLLVCLLAPLLAVACAAPVRSVRSVSEPIAAPQLAGLMESPAAPEASRAAVEPIPSGWAPYLAQSSDAPHGFWEEMHPKAIIYGAYSNGTLRYSTKGTGNNIDAEGGARQFRFFAASFAGFELDWLETGGDFSGGSRLNGFDAFGFANYPLRPADFFRVFLRPGVYYNRMNVKGAQAGDVEPWTIGARAEAEAEFDLYKGERTIVTGFLTTRFGWGWGRADAGGGDESINGPGWGYEIGIRVQGGYVMFALSWIDRGTELRGGRNFGEVDYRFNGGAFTLGGRW